MKSVFETEVDVPQAKLAALYSDPENNTKWMHDLERNEPISGTQGMVGSKYRMVPKKGSMIFTATVVSKELPHEVQLLLEDKNATVLVTGKFFAVSPTRTKFVSEEIFTFKGLYKIFGLLARNAIRKAHHQHMKDFIEFAKTA